MSGRKRKGGATPKTEVKNQAGSDERRWKFAPGCESELVGLSPEAFEGLSVLMERHQRRQTRAGTHFKPLEDGMSELLFEHSNNHSRLIFFPHLGSLVALTAFAKNQEKTPSKDLKRARTRRSAWLTAHAEESSKGGVQRNKK